METKRIIKNSNVAVIGGLGFLGSHLVDHLINDRGCNVLVLDNMISGTTKYLNPKAKYIWCDITHSEGALSKLFKQHEIEYVFNYAAEPYIPVSFERPLHVFDINARGALMVMNAAQDAAVKGILQVSSAEIYGDAPNHPIDEDYPANPHSTYGASKLAIDVLVQARRKEAHTPCIALRQFNCAGTRDFTHPYVIPEIIKQLREGDTIKLGNNSARDFQDAEDAVRMATELLEKGNFGEVYNMGSGEAIKIYDLAHAIGGIMGKTVTIEVDASRVRPWEIWHLQSSNKKLYETIETRPKFTLLDTLTKMVNENTSL